MIQPQRATHILVECPEYIPSVRVGVVEPLLSVGEERVEVRFKRTVKMRAQDIQWADIFVTVRGSEGYSLSVARLAKRYGRLVMYYLDDDLLHVPRHAQTFSYYNNTSIKQNIRDFLELSDVLWVSNPIVCRNYLPLCGHERSLVTHVSVKDLPSEPKHYQGQPVAVLFAGSVDHQEDVRNLLSPAVKCLAQEFSDAVRFDFIGVDPDLKGLSNVRTLRYFDNYAAYCQAVNDGNYLIGLAPSREESFYQHKYVNKFVEYTRYGMVGVYTDCALYQSVIEDGENGFLCANSPDAWYETLRRLIQSPQALYPVAKNALTTLKQNYTQDAFVNILHSDYPELFTHRAPSCDDDIKRQFHRRIVQIVIEKFSFLKAQYGLRAIPMFIVKGVCYFIRRIKTHDE